MKNDFTTAMDEPIGICLKNQGMNDCPRWPDRIPSPCCWLSCNEICATACWKANKKYGHRCEHYGGERCASASTC